MQFSIIVCYLFKAYLFIYLLLSCYYIKTDETLINN